MNKDLIIIKESWQAKEHFNCIMKCVILFSWILFTLIWLLSRSLSKTMVWFSFFRKKFINTRWFMNMSPRSQTKILISPKKTYFCSMKHYTYTLKKITWFYCIKYFYDTPNLVLSTLVMCTVYSRAYTLSYQVPESEWDLHNYFSTLTWFYKENKWFTWNIEIENYLKLVVK